MSKPMCLLLWNVDGEAWAPFMAFTTREDAEGILAGFGEAKTEMAKQGHIGSNIVVNFMGNPVPLNARWAIANLEAEEVDPSEIKKIAKSSVGFNIQGGDGGGLIKP